jgi:hypothetical protein
MRGCLNGHEFAGDEFKFCPICGVALADLEPESDSVAEVAVERNDRGSRTETDLPTDVQPRRRWPLSIGWSVAVGLLTGGVGLLLLLGIFLWRGGQRRGAAAAVAGFAVLSVAVVASLASGGGSQETAVAAGTVPASSTPTTTTLATVRKCSTYKGATKPQTCLSKTGSSCDSYGRSGRPNDCLSAVQLRAAIARKKARAIAVAKAKKSQALASARARAKAAAAAKAQAAAEAAANAWHSGYYQQDENVYWKWLNGRSCVEFASNGCWHVEVITRDGCSSYVAVEANEYQGSSIVGSLLDNQGFGIPPETSRVFELDADMDGVTANDVQITCT